MQTQGTPLPDRLVRELAAIAGEEFVLQQPEDRYTYTYDASLFSGWPRAVVLPGSTAQTAAVLRVLSREAIPFVPRGAGTGLCGGSVALTDAVVVSTARMNRILSIEPVDRLAIVEPGVANLDLSIAARPHGLAYLPDPSSQKVSTIGGNVGTNAGGPHCLAYGVTAGHILGLTLVTPSGDVVELGGACPDMPGYDLTGFLVGSEGMMGIVTRIVCRLHPLPEAVKTLLASFGSIDDAVRSVSAIIAAGIVPQALEMMDGPLTRAVEEAFHAGYPADAAAVLLVELEGLTDGMPALAGRVTNILSRNGATEVREAHSESERALLWAGRKGALAAAARLKPRYYLHDGVVPRTRLLQVIQKVLAIGQEMGLTIVNVMHAGDGNLHPLILFDPSAPGEVARVHQAGERILRACVEAGGTLSGEHGIGVEKNEFMGWLFTAADLAVMRRVRDAFDPAGLSNPGKVFPLHRSCGEGAPAAAAGGDNAGRARQGDAGTGGAGGTGEGSLWI